MAKTKTTSNSKPTAVAPRNASTAVATPQEDLMAALARDAGAGFEEAGQEAYALPFLTVLQDLSPQTKKSRKEYVKGAEPGMIYHTVTQELFERVRIIPCHYSQAFIEWIPREKKGGFVAAHPSNTPLVRQTTRDERNNSILPNGNILQDTRQHFVLLVREDDTTDGCLMAMKSTQLKVSRRWMSHMRAATIASPQGPIRAPMWAYAYDLTTEEVSNDQGTWYQWVIGGQQQVSNLNHYRAAKLFGETMRGGGARVNYEELDPARDPIDGSHAGAPQDLDDNDIPA